MNILFFCERNESIWDGIFHNRRHHRHECFVANNDKQPFIQSAFIRDAINAMHSFVDKYITWTTPCYNACEHYSIT